MTRTGSITVGLTGSIGMGKSTVAGFFAQAGAGVWDADEAVHRLYGPDADGARAIAKLAPEAVGIDGVDRKTLAALIQKNENLLKQVEAVIHPLVAKDREIYRHSASFPVLVFDIPLLFENGMQDQFDHVVVVSCLAETQRKRVLARPGMTAEKFEFILDRQMPDAEKRTLADFLVETDGTLDDTLQQVQRIYRGLLET